MKLLIFGNGWLGNILRDYFVLQGYEVELSGHKKLEHVPVEDLEKEISAVNVVINVAGKTNIDFCEKNQEETFVANVMVAHRLAKICKKTGTKYVFFSSACIFQSKHANDIKHERSKPNPGCYYAETKVAAEQLITAVLPEALIIRPRLPVHSVPHPRNTVDKLLSYKKIHNNQESITIVDDLLPVLKGLLESNASGAYNLTNPGTVSPVEIAKLFDHPGFEVFTKEEEVKQMKEEGRAVRVSTIIGTKKGVFLSPVHGSLLSIAEKYKQHKV